jgi:hypothetical protein
MFSSIPLHGIQDAQPRAPGRKKNAAGTAEPESISRYLFRKRKAEVVEEEGLLAQHKESVSDVQGGMKLASSIQHESRHIQRRKSRKRKC